MSNFQVKHLNHVSSSIFSWSSFKSAPFLSSCLIDFENEITYLSTISRPVEYHNFVIDYKIVPDLRFDASINLTGPISALTKINLGTWIALQDLFYRMCSNETFFSYGNENPEKRLWTGCQCIWTKIEGMQPRSRFSDYRISESWGDPRHEHVGHFFETIPYGDPERMKLAQMLTRTAVLWIILHEEGHFLDGHLAYLNIDCGLTFSEAVIEEAAASEGVNRSDEKLRRYFEFSADRTATNGVFDILFMDEKIEALPSYCRDEPEKWLFRLLVVAIGSVLQVLQKSHNRTNTIGFYPNSKARFAAAMRHLGNKLLSNRPAHCCRKPVVANPFEIPNLFQGGCDDLCSVAALINREGELDPERNEAAPIRKRTGIHGLFETEETVSDFAEILKIIFIHPDERHGLIGRIHGDDRIPELFSRFEYWFEDFEDAETAYKNFFNINLRRYRDSYFS